MYGNDLSRTHRLPLQIEGKWTAHPLKVLFYVIFHCQQTIINIIAEKWLWRACEKNDSLDACEREGETSELNDFDSSQNLWI